MAASPLVWRCISPGKWETTCGRFRAYVLRSSGNAPQWDLVDQTGERLLITDHPTLGACKDRALVVLAHPHTGGIR